MDIDYLTNEIIPRRAKEINEGKNLATAQPIYIVYSLEEKAIEGHSEFLGSSTNYKGKSPMHGYIDTDVDEPYFNPSKIGMKDPLEVTIFWIDRYVAVFLTSSSAYDYLSYQSHNITDGYVYVHYSGYGNREMDMLLSGG